MLKIGLTGGIGSGKTMVANLFAQQGVPIIDTDQIARDVVLPNTPGWGAIVEHFGDAILKPGTQTINRRLLRENIFNNPEEKTWLELLLHPLIRNGVDEAVASLHADYCILVIPLLFESAYDYKLDRILVVDAPIEKQISRVITRDQAHREQIEKIIAQQISREERLARADDIIENTSDNVADLSEKVENLHKAYLELAHQKKP